MNKLHTHPLSTVHLSVSRGHSWDEFKLQLLATNKYFGLDIFTIHLEENDTFVIVTGFIAVIV